MTDLIENFLPSQYRQNDEYKINHNYLRDQFSDKDQILEKIRRVVERGDFTLGEEVDLFEREFASLSGVKFAVGVGSGTDALFLSLKAHGVGPGDEVITTPFTFYATIGAIVTAGAKPIFVDAGEDFNIDYSLIESKITSSTKAIMPVHWSGRPCEMDQIIDIGARKNIPIISDACHAIKAEYKGNKIGGLGEVACFSFHPLKNLNVWGDGGIVATNSSEVAAKLRLLRNHGLASRDECQVFAYNSRLDTIQAVVARHMLEKIESITESRINNAHYFDEALSSITQISIPHRHVHLKEVFHLYSIVCERRNELQKFLNQNGVDAKIHYPVPMHLQPAASHLGYKQGDFPIAEKLSKNTISLPVHEFITKADCDHVIKLIQHFYG
ncbi:MAG: DegT/DnrJ/EryC1/StrS family aminotransferase [Polynucleobacter sp.]|nr:DegT/DnrJ/EryC1/StrS family aminotransferase [Polynucleobacter sp.]